MERSIWRLLIVVSWLAGTASRAETIKWFCAPGSTNLTSSNAPMGAAFNFELGVFNNNFVPTAANVAQWATNWAPAQRVAYSGTNNYFIGQCNVVNNTAPFTVGKAAYVWGFQTGASASEWILLSDPDWTWPSSVSNPMNPFGIDWNVATATALIGSVNASGSPFLLKSATVTSWQQWRDTELVGEPYNGPNDDPDHDGGSNLLEFVFGTPPKQPGGPPATPVEMVTSNSQRFQQIAVPRRADRLATLTVQVSPDLTSWTSGPTATAVISDTPTSLVTRDLTPLGVGASKRFMRVKAELPTP